MSKRTKRSTKSTTQRDDRSDFMQPRHRSTKHSHHNPHEQEYNPDRAVRQIKRKRVELVPRNLAQERYLKVLDNDDMHIVFAMGPAGTGKTMLATQYAIKALQEGLIDKIIITRPAVSVDEDHGFLPGTLIEKMAPWVIPIMDVFKEHYSPQQIEAMLIDEQIEIAPLAFMRGRTLKNAIVLFDEAQNATPNQMKMMLTRIGENSKIVVTGDISQHDRGYEQNGLKDVVTRIRDRRPDMISIVEFGSMDIERHPVVEVVLDLYGDDAI